MKWLDRALLVSPYHYGLCKTEKAFRKELKRLCVPKADWPQFLASKSANATTHFFEKRDGIGLCCIVCMPVANGVSKPQICGLLVHEAAHIWQEIRENIGEQSPSKEFEAYAIQTISQRLMEAYFGKRKGE